MKTNVSRMATWMMVSGLGVAALTQSGCAAESSTSVVGALSGPDDCRLSETCEGLGPAEPVRDQPIAPLLRDVPVPERTPERPEVPGRYREDTAGWIHGAVSFAERQGAMAGLPSFEISREGTEHGVVLLWSTAVAERGVAPSAWLRSDGDDVASVIRASQSYARARGYLAALPYFEEQVSEERQPFDSIALLATNAIELEYVDLAALGAPEPADVVAVFAGASRYAVERGFAGALPTFETITDGRRTAMSIVLFRIEHAYPTLTPEAEISPVCGRYGLATCEHGELCIGGHRQVGGLCADTSQSCGNIGQPCCGGICEGNRLCTFNGLGGRQCPFETTTPVPPLTQCGDGRCTVDEQCHCLADCGPPPYACRALPAGPLLCTNVQTVTFCRQCPGEVSQTLRVHACDGRPFLAPRVPRGCSLEPGECT